MTLIRCPMMCERTGPMHLARDVAMAELLPDGED
jgi:hypothetical protein